MNHLTAPDIPDDLDWLVEPPRGRSLRDHLGRAVLLDFWTRSCVACTHGGQEIDRLADRFGSSLLVVGVHSPKFPGERSAEVVCQAIAQLRVRHPVVNDPDLRLWQLYDVQQWPTAVLIGPDGVVAAQAVGPEEIAALDGHIERLVGGPDGRSSRPAPAENGATALRFPHRCLQLDDTSLLVSEQYGDVVVVDTAGAVQRRLSGFGDPVGMCHLPDGRVAVADAAHHAVYGVELSTVRREVLVTTVVGAGIDRSGHRDGPAASALMQHPAGLTRTPEGTLLVADVFNGSIRRYDPTTDELDTIAVGLAEPRGWRASAQRCGQWSGRPTDWCPSRPTRVADELCGWVSRPARRGVRGPRESRALQHRRAHAGHCTRL
ncbi:MAG: hypothetical protein P8N02_10545 [Actinomycetota bacterium]|nr:hypothetical protein [Actinomycetota bacterium]